MFLNKIFVYFFSPLDILDEEDDGLFDLIDIIPEFGLDTIVWQIIVSWFISGLEFDDFIDGVFNLTEEKTSKRAKWNDSWDDDNELMQGWVVAGTVSSLAPFASPIAADVFYVLCGTLMTFISTTLAHIALTGLRFFAFFVPAGVPFLFAPLLTMVDFVTHFARFISLSVRILANITAGHALMKIILGFACDFFSVLSIFSILGVLPAILLFILMALETFIAFLQGYIFALLNGSYQSEISA